MSDKKREEVSERVFDGIDDAYIAELTELLMAEPQKMRQKNIIWTVLAVATVLALIIVGTINIFHHQNRENIPAQTGGSTEETKGQLISSSENNGGVTTQDNAAIRDDEVMKREIDELLDQIFPKRSEMYYQALGISGYSDEEIQGVRDWEESREEQKVNFYEKMLKGSSKEQVIEQLTQMVQEYPELTDEQELEYRTKLLDYNEYAGSWTYDTIMAALYYDEIGRCEEQLSVIVTEETAQILKGEWSVLKACDANGSVDQVKDWYYGSVRAKTVLELLGNKDAAEIYLIAKEYVPCRAELYDTNQYARTSTAREIRFKQYYFHYIIETNDDGTMYLTQKDIEM